MGQNACHIAISANDGDAHVATVYLLWNFLQQQIHTIPSLMSLYPEVEDQDQDEDEDEDEDEDDEVCMRVCVCVCVCVCMIWRRRLDDGDGHGVSGDDVWMYVMSCHGMV